MPLPAAQSNAAQRGVGLKPTRTDLFNDSGRSFSCSTIHMLADQMIDLLEYVHVAPRS